jgi:transcriptional regulator with XRE-family HTH domain
MPESISLFRKEKGLTQEGLGKAIAKRLQRPIGDSYAQKKIARFESGASLPTAEEFHAMADVLGVDVEALKAAVAGRPPHEGPSRMGELGVTDDNGWCLMAVCILSRPRPQILDESFKAVEEAIAKRHFSMAVFLPYPSAVGVPETSDHINNLIGYQARVRKSLMEANLIFLNALGPELAKSAALYVPRAEITTTVLIPPVFRQYALTLRQVAPNAPISKSLDMWTPGQETDVSRPIRPTGVYSLEEQMDAWESYFGDVIPHWTATRTFIASDAYWTRIR